MPQFSVNIVTPAGRALLARASSALQLIYTRVMASETALTAAEAAASVPAGFPVAGTILAASATENVARIVGKISSASLSAAVTLKSFALCAKIDGDAEDAVLAVLSDANASVPLPGSSAVDVNAEIGFLLTITDAGQVTVEVTGAGSVTFGDIARFLSLYKAGDPTKGEAQTVRGEKTFSGDVQFLSTLAVHANAEMDVYGRANFDGAAVFGNGLTADNDVHIRSGASLSVSGQVSCSAVDFGDGRGIGELTVYQASGGSLFAGAVTGGTTHLTGLEIVQDHSYNTSKAMLTAAVEYGTWRDAAKIGPLVEDGNAFIYAQAFNLVQPQGREEYEIDPTTYATFEIDATAIHFSVRMDAPEVGVSLGYIDGEPFFYPDRDNVITLGEADHRWSGLFVNRVRTSEMSGLDIPQQSGNTGIQMPIGAYTMLKLVSVNAQSWPDAMIGSRFTLTPTMQGFSGDGAQRFADFYVFAAAQTVQWEQDGSNRVATFLAMRVG